MAAVISDEVEVEDKELCSFKATQQILKKACKRMRLYCNGTKTILVQRLENMRVKTKQKAEQLAHKLKTEVPLSAAENSFATFVRTLQLTWNLIEIERLVHVFQNPQDYCAFSRLNKKPKLKAELEEKRHDQRSVDFVQL